MRIGAIGFDGMQSYRISSVHGNPVSLTPVSSIGENRDSNKALVIAEKVQDQDALYVKDYGQLESPNNTVTGGFADILSMQELFAENTTQTKTDSAQDMTYINDTIGMMGFQNHLRDQLLGVGFEPFTA